MAAPTWSFSQKFSSQFQTSRSDLEARVEAARSSAVVSEELCKELSSDLARLVKDLADATGSIPSYDQRQNEEQLKALELSVSDLLRSSRPKSKFAFKRKAATPASINSSRPTDTVGPRNTIPQLVPTTNLSISGHTSQLLTPDSLPSSSSSGRDLAIHDLSGCIVNLLPSDGRTSLDLSAVHIQDLTDTVLLLPAINGSVLIHNLRKCTIVVGCHQFRMHSSQNVDIYLDITSNPIIEHCSTIRFGGYPDSLGLAQKPSKHYDVLDFSHIRSDPSPNWSTLTEDRISPLLALHDISVTESVNATRERMLPA